MCLNIILTGETITSETADNAWFEAPLKLDKATFNVI